MKLTIQIFGTALIAMIMALPAKSQEIVINDQGNKYFAEKSIAVSALKKDTMFKKTLKWLYKEFPKTGKKGTYINADIDRIVTHQYFHPDPENIDGFTHLRIGFILTLGFKDREFKYKLSDFYYFSSGEGMVPFESQKFLNYDTLIRDKMVKETEQYVSNLIEDLTTYLQNLKTK
jgi:hypothetical protein